MRITLARPREGVGQADETVDVEIGLARRLLDDGAARVPDPSAMTVGDIEEAAAASGVDLSAAKSKADKLAALEAAQKEG